MTSKRIFASALALSLSLTACTTSQAFTMQVDAAAQTQASLMDDLTQIRTDIVSQDVAIDADLVGRLDNLISNIDDMLDAKPTSETELLELRDAAVELRSQVQSAIAGNAKSLVMQIAGQLAPAPPMNGVPALPQGGSIISDTVVGEQVIGNSFGAAPMGAGPINGGFSAGMTSGGGGGFAGAGGGAAGGGGGFGLLSAGGAAAALAVGLSDDDDSPGVIASPSGL